MASTATRSSQRKTVSTNTRSGKNESRSTASIKNQPAARSIASTKPGKSGAPQAQSKLRSGSRTALRDIPKATLKEMKDLQSLGIAMTNIHLIVQRKLPKVRYYDVWKALRKA